MRKKIIGLLGVFIPLACYAHAGFYDRYLDMMDVLYAVLKTIFVLQLVLFLLIRFNWLKTTKKLRIKLLLCAKRLCNNWLINLLAAWALSSFVLASYIYVFSMSFFWFAIVPFALFALLYIVVVFREKMRIRWLSGLKAIYLYLIATMGQIIVFIVYILFYLIMWYGPVTDFSNYLHRLYRHTHYMGHDYVFMFAKDICYLSLYMAIPYLLLVATRIFRNLIRIIKR